MLVLMLMLILTLMLMLLLTVCKLQRAPYVYMEMYLGVVLIHHLPVFNQVVLINYCPPSQTIPDSAS
jgi:hypothetical protein